ncbi:fructoselysine 6-kinase [Kineococcus sp. SYSU DK002]|uniref:fructoselysine 6-kinase n=1 Tax=Kineococcus sp. SYSU DK002 TaxID=3383123 RepID=UPI003D7EBD3D
MRVAAAGDNCIDVYAGQGRSYPGGNAVNVAVYLRRLGVDSSYVGAVGDDAHGDLLRRALEGKGVDTSHLRVSPGSTALTQIEVVDGNRVFGEHDEGVMADFRLTADDLDFLCGHDLVVSGIWGHTAGDLAALKARGATIAFDYSDQPQDPVVDASLGDVDYAFFGLEADDGEELREFVRRAQARGPVCVVATLGARGSIAYDGREFTVVGPVPGEVVDTMGAGDSYIAGFLTGVLDGRPLAECMARGAASSAVTLTYPGAW